MNSKKFCACACCGDRLTASCRRSLKGKCVRLFVAACLFPASLPTDSYICTKCRFMFNQWTALPEFCDVLTTINNNHQAANVVTDVVSDENEDNGTDQLIDDTSSVTDSMDDGSIRVQTVNASFRDSKSIYHSTVTSDQVDDEEITSDKSSEVMDTIPSDENIDEQGIKVPIEVSVFSKRWFSQTIQNSSLPSVHDFMAILAALNNCFYVPTVVASSEDDDIVRRMNQLLSKSNILQERLIQDNLQRHNVWQLIDIDNLFEPFPVLSLDDIRSITLGVYQLKRARSYAEEHSDCTELTDLDADFPIEACTEHGAEDIIRLRFPGPFWVQSVPLLYSIVLRIEINSIQYGLTHDPSSTFVKKHSCENGNGEDQPCKVMDTISSI
ncbi:unnamed protein product [Rotaria magnacalcarata]|uniref:Uncharacterized protein n=4 Tax=Rotaria magnacalcarata TaxID=392030 RepID=A0A815XQ53_9BILA|nr:unnamed protein product [Rotaria magnacalcarata]CAF4037778.1 unnamed protein product [Rotaria magnacalcarata]CAF4219512.1 unnamed protein product [Rotaria magnacalcarata]